jgi:Zn-dependent alcohol dehydrogenase
MRTTAAVTDERSADFAVQDVEIDGPRPGEVRVEIAACGVCHTDAIARDGDLPFPPPAYSATRASGGSKPWAMA